MRFQFSILTMLVCTAALAAAFAACISIAIREPTYIFQSVTVGGVYQGGGLTEWKRQPSGSEIAWRMAWAGPLAVFISLCLLWASRRFFMRGRV